MLKLNLLKFFITIISLGFYSFSFANIASFEVKANPSKLKVGETLDLTIKALDKDGNVLKNYTGEILIFSQSDPKAEFPGLSSENTYKFKTSDSGEVKFENGVKFSKPGIQDINVYDISNEDIFGFTEVEVIETSKVRNENITISYPENGMTLGINKIKVSGSTLKNHRVKIILNTDKTFEGISNSEGIFEIDVTNIPSGENFLKAELYDSDNNIIGTSNEVLFKIESNAPKFKSIKLTPNSSEVDPETIISVELSADPNLMDVSLILNDLITKLTEKSPGIYTGNITAPKEFGNYKIDVILKNELGIETRQNGAASINVRKIELTSAGDIENPKSEINCDDLKNISVSGINLTKLKTKSILSWNKIDKASSYNVYKKDKNTGNMVLIENVTDNKIEINITGDVVEYDDFAVKAVFKDNICDVESTNYSEMTKVQTGPKEIFILLTAILLTILIFIFRKKYLKS